LGAIRFGGCLSGAPKGQLIAAQGNALGFKSSNIPSPVRAAQSTQLGKAGTKKKEISYAENAENRGGQ